MAHPRMLVLLALIWLAAPVLASAPRLPIEEILKKPEFQQMTLSPDGTHLAALAPLDNRMNVIVINLKTRKALPVTNVREQDVLGLTWANNDRLLFFMDDSGNESFGIYAVDKNGKNQRTLASPVATLVRRGGTTVRVTSLLDTLPDRPDHILVSSNERLVSAPDVYLLRIHSSERKSEMRRSSGQRMLHTRNNGHVVGWGTSWKSELLFAVERRGQKTRAMFRPTESSEWTAISEWDFGQGGFSASGISADGSQLYVVSTLTPDGQKRDRAALYTYDIAEGKLGELLFEHPRVDVGGVMQSRKDGRLLAAAYYDDKPGMHYFDEDYAARQKIVDGAFPDTVNTFASVTRAEDKAIVVTSASNRPGRFYLYDFEANRIEALANSREWLKSEALASMQPIEVPTRDGLTMQGYLTRPVGALGPTPLILNVHGGPWARDTYGFSPEVQFLSNRGYAVLQVNFRGSTGFGESFMMAGNREWGGKMQDDLSDAVQWAIDQGYADKDRVCIMGGSYGGYAAMAGATFTPELYRCAVNIVGVTSLPLLFESMPRAWKQQLPIMKLQVGDPQTDIELLRQRSPVFHADRIQAPIFMAYGRQDPRVVIDHAQDMEAALKAAGKEYELVIYDDEGHGFRKYENQLDYYKRLEAFLEKALAVRGDS